MPCTPVMPLTDPEPDPNALLLLCLLVLQLLDLMHPDALFLLEVFHACGSPAAVAGPVWILKIFALSRKQFMHKSHLCFSGQSHPDS